MPWWPGLWVTHHIVCILSLVYMSCMIKKKKEKKRSENDKRGCMLRGRGRV